jgi:hypothetical protein
MKIKNVEIFFFKFNYNLIIDKFNNMKILYNINTS